MAKNLISAGGFSRRWIGITEMLLSGVCFGFLGVFGKQAYALGVLPGELLAARFMVASTLLGVFLALTSPKELRLSRGEILRCLVLGVMGYAVFASFYFEALSGLSASLTVMLLYAYPVLVTLGARVLYGEPVGRGGWIALPLVMLGLVMLVWGEFQVRAPRFLIFGFASAVFYAVYILAPRKWLARTASLPAVVFIQAGAAASLGLLHFHEFGRLFTVITGAWVPLLGLALVSTVAAMSLFLNGLKKLRSSEAAILSAAEPVTACLASAVFLGDRMSVVQLTGGALVLGAMWVIASYSQGSADSTSEEKLK